MGEEEDGEREGKGKRKRNLKRVRYGPRESEEE